MGALCSSAGAGSVTLADAMPPFYVPNAVVDDRQLAIIRRTWHLIVDEADSEAGFADSRLAASRVVTFYDSFYTHLFEIEPSCKPLFRNSLKSQGRALVKMIQLAVSLLGTGNVEGLTAQLKQLSARHVTYGVHPYHYSPVGLCILHAFEKTIPEEEWDDEAKKAWINVYSLICQVMIPVAVEGWFAKAEIAPTQVLVSEPVGEFVPRRARSSDAKTVGSDREGTGSVRPIAVSDHAMRSRGSADTDARDDPEEVHEGRSSAAAAAGASSGSAVAAAPTAQRPPSATRSQNSCT
ncbi:hypothetical protein FNF27_02995 [Cafeteria roenbergensis]|uniref:Globin domain-containing protein n=1 Tax=Cafeteria roenbergensis TaxID=33653 RepID=A0A5A8ECM4_CAFRO|nr:hypothetical protein FNF27_02995 [Cafeteria roenbergensis]